MERLASPCDLRCNGKSQILLKVPGLNVLATAKTRRIEKMANCLEMRNPLLNTHNQPVTFLHKRLENPLRDSE